MGAALCIIHGHAVAKTNGDVDVFGPEVPKGVGHKPCRLPGNVGVFVLNATGTIGMPSSAQRKHARSIVQQIRPFVGGPFWKDDDAGTFLERCMTVVWWPTAVLLFRSPKWCRASWHPNNGPRFGFRPCRTPQETTGNKMASTYIDGSHQHCWLSGQVSFPADANAEAVESAKKLNQLALDVLTDLMRGLPRLLRQASLIAMANWWPRKYRKTGSETTHGTFSEVGKIEPILGDATVPHGQVEVFALFGQLERRMMRQLHFLEERQMERDVLPDRMGQASSVPCKWMPWLTDRIRRWRHRQWGVHCST